MLRVVTLTPDAAADPLLRRCRQSVGAALFDGARHDVIECRGDFGQARMDAALSEEFVAFVDSDDAISRSALRLCMQALEESGAAIAVTNQVQVSAVSGFFGSAQRGGRTYERVALSPMEIHHLCVFRSSHVDPVALQLHREVGGIGIDWFIKAGAAMSGGAVHVPVDGYFWTAHNQSSMSGREGPSFREQMPTMRKLIGAAWKPRAGGIPVFEVDDPGDPAPTVGRWLPNLLGKKAPVA